MPRPFRFGVQLSRPTDGAGWVERARRIEDLGYAVATMPDHFTDQLAPTPALQAVLDATTTLRAGALVFANDYRHPLVAAKELATMDVLSDGRVEIGLGAGWMTSDYRQAGITYDRPGVRIDRFSEGLAVMKGALGDGPFSFAGEHYTISGYDGLPKPVQRPHPPVVIGGGGRRLLSIAAREADVVGVNPTLDSGALGAEAMATMTDRAVTEKVRIVAEAAAEAGRLSDIEINIRVFFVRVTESGDAATAAIAGNIGVDEHTVTSLPYALVGPPSAIAEKLVERRERFGFSYVIVGDDVVDDFGPVVARLAGT